MAGCLLVLLLLVSGLCSLCESAPLQTTLAGRSGSTSCVGDTVTYTCTLAAVAHGWRIPSLGLNEDITRANPTFSDSQFTIATTADGGGANPITTTLTVTSSVALNGATITCSDANLATPEIQETTGMVFGSPSAPGFTAEAGGDSVSYYFTIIPSSPSDCVLSYTITATSSDNSRNITVPASGSTLVNEGGFDVCTVAYNFSVAPVTIEGTAPSSASIVTGVAPVTGLQATLTGLAWLAPSNLPTTCFPQYIISLTDDPTTNLTVNDNSVSSAALNARGFPYCVSLSVTVTPILMSTSAPLTTRSVSEVVALNDLDIGSIQPTVEVQQISGTVNVRVTFEGVESEGRNVVIGRSSPGGSDCMDVATIDGSESMEYAVQLDCSYDGTSVTVCVRYTTGGCSSMESRRTISISADQAEDEVCPNGTSSSNGAAITTGIAGGLVAGVILLAGVGTTIV